jgi:predicted metallopeptidase
MEKPLLQKHFDFCRAIHRLCIDICDRHDEFRHIRMSEVVVSFAQTRSPVEWGMQAKLTPLRFEGGARTTRRHRKTWTVQRVYANGQEMLYILTFYLPRFLNMTFEEKLVTIFHELYHISPEFDGDIRRFSGACYIHTGSQKNYDRQMGVFAREWMQRQPPEQLWRFLTYDFQQLRQRFGNIVGIKVAIPRLIPLDEAA